MDFDAFCNRCLHRKFNLKEGIICGLTDQKPNFENNCKDFKVDAEADNKEMSIKIREIYKKANNAKWASGISIVMSFLLAKNTSYDIISRNEIFTLIIIAIPIVISLVNILNANMLSKDIPTIEKLSKAKKTILLSIILCLFSGLYALIRIAG